MTSKQIGILWLLLFLWGQGPLLFAQDAKRLKTVRFLSMEMKEGNDKSVVEGSVDVYFWSTYSESEKEDEGNQLIGSEDKINISLTNFQWEKLRWGLGRTVLTFQGNRFSRENPAFKLEQLSDGNRIVETDQSVFLPIATPSDPGKIEFLISPQISKTCTTNLTLRLKLYAIKKNNVDEPGELERITPKDILIEIPFNVLPPTKGDDLAWEKVTDLSEDIFGQTAAIQNYLANFGECGKYARQANESLMANEDRLCQELDESTAESYLRLYKKLGWKGSCVSKAKTLSGSLKEEDFFTEALISNQLPGLCEFLGTYDQVADRASEVRQIQLRLNKLIGFRWEAQFDDRRPDAEEDRASCTRFLSYLDQCPARIMDAYIDKENARRRWLARLCVRTADQCEMLWREIESLPEGEKRTRIQREYCDACFQSKDQLRYLEVLKEVKTKITPLNSLSTRQGRRSYSFQLSYFAPPLLWVAATQEKKDALLELSSPNQLLIIYPGDSIPEDEGNIQIRISQENTLDILIPSGIQGIFHLTFIDSLGKNIFLDINTYIKPLEAQVVEGWFEGEYRIKMRISGGDSLLANGKGAYRLIFQQLDDPEISFAFPFENDPPDGAGIFVVDKEKKLGSLPDGLYEVIVRDGRNDEMHELRLGQPIAIKHGGRIPTDLLKTALAVVLLLMVSWLTYANIHVARKVRKR